MVTTYSAVSTTLAYAVGWTDVFTNSGENLGCPITTCTLRTADCSAVAVVNTNFYMAAASPWGLTAKRNDITGWGPITFCYRCEGTAQGGFHLDSLVGYSI